MGDKFKNKWYYLLAIAMFLLTFLNWDYGFYQILNRHNLFIVVFGAFANASRVIRHLAYKLSSVSIPKSLKTMVMSLVVKYSPKVRAICSFTRLI